MAYRSLLERNEPTNGAAWNDFRELVNSYVREQLLELRNREFNGMIATFDTRATMINGRRLNNTEATRAVTGELEATFVLERFAQRNRQPIRQVMEMGRNDANAVIPQARPSGVRNRF